MIEDGEGRRELLLTRYQEGFYSVKAYRRRYEAANAKTLMAECCECVDL